MQEKEGVFAFNSRPFDEYGGQRKTKTLSVTAFCGNVGGK